MSNEPKFCDHEEVHTTEGELLVTRCRRCPSTAVADRWRYQRWPRLGPFLLDDPTTDEELAVAEAMAGQRVWVVVREGLDGYPARIEAVCATEAAAHRVLDETRDGLVAAWMADPTSRITAGGEALLLARDLVWMEECEVSA